VTDASDQQPAARPTQHLTPERVRSMHFSRTPMGRRGLSEDEVALFLHRVADDLAARDAAEASLRAKVAHYKDTLMRWQSEAHTDLPAGARAASAESPIEAVNILSQAQQEADAYVAQAEEYCRRLAADARDHAQEIVSEAQAAAEAAAREHRLLSGDGQPAELEELEHRLVWARSFLASLETVEAQLRTAREALAYELGRMRPPAPVPGPG
jgi:DivIVA domain-containing protein